MSQIAKIDKEETALAQLGLSYDLIMAGEHAELDPEVKIKRKVQYVPQDLVNAVISAYADDLLSAYKVNESLYEHIDAVQEDLGKAADAFEKTKAQLQQILNSEENLSVTENLLATLETQIDKFADAKVLDDKMINQLRDQISEVEKNQVTVAALAEEVDTVLDSLRQYFAEEGIDVGE